MAQKSSDQSVQSLERTLAILEALGKNPQGLGITEMGQIVNLHKSTVHRLVNTLLSYGYVEQDKESERYRLGIKIVSLGLDILNNLDVRKEALPYIKELVEISRETVQLVVLDHSQVVVIERDHSPETITVNLGLRADVHCTAEGKVLLAYLSQERIIKILERRPMRQYTVNTLTDISDMLVHLEKVRKQGYAINAEELAEGLRSVAAPVFDHRGKVIAALSISGPTPRLNLERISRLMTVLKEASHSISFRLGYREKSNQGNQQIEWEEDLN